MEAVSELKGETGALPCWEVQPQLGPRREPPPARKERPPSWADVGCGVAKAAFNRIPRLLVSRCALPRPTGVQPSPAPPHVLLPALCPEAGDGVWPAETQNFSGTTPYSGDPPHRHGVLVTLTNAHKRHGCPFQVSGDQQGLRAAGESRSAAPL